MSVIVVTNENFKEEVLESKMPVLVDFWAQWCGPCRMLSPIVDQVAEETESFKVCKVDTDEQMELADKYNVMSIPTLVVIKNGVEAARSLGVISKEEIYKLVENA